MTMLHIVDGVGTKVEYSGENVPIPRIGDAIDMGYAPAPIVKQVLWRYMYSTLVVHVWVVVA